jgi:hypothetical protein
MYSRDMTGRRISHSMVEKEFVEYCKKKNEED